MQLVISPLEFQVEKLRSKLKQELIMSTVDRYKLVVWFCELYRYLLYSCASLQTLQRFLQVAAISSCIPTPNCFKFTRLSNFRHAPLMKRDFQEKIWMIINRSKYVLNKFIKEFKIWIFLQASIFRSPLNLLPLKEATLYSRKMMF